MSKVRICIKEHVEKKLPNDDRCKVRRWISHSNATHMNAVFEFDERTRSNDINTSIVASIRVEDAKPNSAVFIRLT